MDEIEQLRATVAALTARVEALEKAAAARAHSPLDLIGPGTRLPDVPGRWVSECEAYASGNGPDPTKRGER